MDFYYDGKHSNDFGITVTEVSEPNFGMERETIIGEKTKYKHKSHLLGVKYVENLYFVLSVVKDFCLYPDQSDSYFTSMEMSKINAWLTSPQTYRLFHFEDNDYFVGDYAEYFAIIRNITSVDNDDGYVTELEIEVECDSPYAWSREFKKSATATSLLPATITVQNNTDEREEYVYPYIEVYGNSSCSVTITNLDDGDRSFTFNISSGQTIIVDSLNRKFMDKSGKLLKYSDYGIKDVDKILLPRLVHGSNRIKVTGDVSVTMKYRVPRKVGAF